MLQPGPWTETALQDLPARLSHASAEGVLWQDTESEFLLRVPGVGRYYARRGREILIGREPGVADNEVCMFLQGLPLAAYFVQQGFLTFHGSAVETPRGGVLLVGGSASGKSTLVTALARKGYPILADEVAPVHFGERGAPTVQPAMSQVFLWEDAARRLGCPIEKPVRSGVARYMFSDLPSRREPAPLFAIYFLNLTNSPPLRVEETWGKERLLLLHQQTCFNNILTESPSRSRLLFARTAAALSELRLKRIQRLPDCWCLDEVVQLFEEELAA